VLIDSFSMYCLQNSQGGTGPLISSEISFKKPFTALHVKSELLLLLLHSCTIIMNVVLLMFLCWDF